MRFPLAVLLIAAAGTAAAQPPRMRDSAGIRIIENPSRMTAPVAFRLGTRTMDIGGPTDDPDDELRQNPVGGIRLSDGTLAVPDGTRIQYFDSRGRRTAILGRSGAGPSEFRSASSLEACRTRGDTLVVADYRNGHFAVVHGNRVVRTTAYSIYGGTVAGCFDDGTVLMQGGLPNFKAPSFTIRLNRLRLDGTFVNEVGKFTFRTPNQFIGATNPTARPSGQRIYLGDGAASEVRVFRSDGRLTDIIRTADPVNAITAAEVEKVIQQSPPAVRDQWRPPTHPAYRSLLVDALGRLWIQDYPARPDRDGWTAFDATGRLIGRLELPRQIEKGFVFVSAFGTDTVQFWYMDAEGFRHLLVYSILRV